MKIASHSRTRTADKSQIEKRLIVGSHCCATNINRDYEIVTLSFWLAAIASETRKEEAEGGLEQPCCCKQGISSFRSEEPRFVEV